jgi:succinate dehydrogenase hydrophobic anchor subunit
MYDEVVTTLRTSEGITSVFRITMGFAMVMDTRSIQDEVPCMLFAAIVLVYETIHGVNAMLEIWREALESKNFRLNRGRLR